MLYSASRTISTLPVTGMPNFGFGDLQLAGDAYAILQFHYAQPQLRDVEVGWKVMDGCEGQQFTLLGQRHGIELKHFVLAALLADHAVGVMQLTALLAL